MQAKDALKMTTDDKRRKRQDELNYRTDLLGAIFMMIVAVVLLAIVVAGGIAVATELVK